MIIINACIVHVFQLIEHPSFVTEWNIFNGKQSLSEEVSVKPLSHQSGVLTAFPQRSKNADRRGAHCAVASNAVCALCNRLERHAAAFVLDMLKTNAAGWRLHSVLDSALWQC